MAKIKSEINMTEGNLAKKVVLFAIPIALSGWLQLLYSAADLITCGKFGSANSVGAISATTSISFFIISIFLGFGIGSNVVMANSYGAKDPERGRRVIGSSYALALVAGIVLMIVGVTCSRFFLEWMNTPEDIIDLSTTYMRIYFIGIPFVVMYNFGAALLRGMGDTTKPFIFLTISGVINVSLNFLFVIVFEMDVAGVATTTVISQFIAATLTTWALIKNKGFANLSIRNIRFHKKETLDIIRVGLPAGVQSSLFSLSNVLIQSSVNFFGSSCDTGVGAASNIESFLNTAQDSFAQAGVAFISANLGAKELKNIDKSFKWSLIDSCSVSVVLGVIVCLLARPLVSIYTSDPVAIDYGVEKLYILASSYILFAVVDTVSNAERGLGYSTLSMIISLLGICGLRIVYLYAFFPIEEFHTPFWLFMSYPISWLITALAHLVCYYFIRKKTFNASLKTKN